MDTRQRSWPRIWLMTDERMGDGLCGAIDRVPERAGVVVRHYSLGAEDRAELAERIAQIARRRGLVVAVAGDVDLAERVGAELVHNPGSDPGQLPFSRSVHSVEEAEAAKADGAALAFVSPVFATCSHPGAPLLGEKQASMIARAAGVPAIALGGMNAANFGAVKNAGFYGWAGIDAWLRD